MPTFLKTGIIEPRVYQEVLAARVLEKGNTLIVAPTALGKTIVAAMIINQRLAQFPQKKILVLAPTKPLAVQHQQTFQRVFDIPSDQIELLTGSVSPEKRKKAWERACIISATPQAIENDVISGRLQFKDFSLIVFDEAHRAVGDYSYVFLASRYQKQAEQKLVLGLTASPGSDSEKIQDVCKNLFIENIEIKTLQDTDVKPYTNEIKLEWQTVNLSEEFLSIKGLLREFQKEQLLFLKKLGLGRNINPQFMRRSELLALQSQIRKGLVQRAEKNPALWSAVSRIAALLKISHAETLLETQGIPPLKDYFERMKAKEGMPGSPKALKTVLADERIARAMKLTEQLFGKKETHPKQEKLKEILRQQFASNPESKVIVFNHYRDSVKNLTEALEAVPGIKPLRFVGQATKENDKGMSQKEQTKRIAEFREGDYNTLIASSVHPDEFIMIKNDSTNQIEIKKIGEFVDAFIPHKPTKSETTKINGYSALSFDGKKTDFYPLTHVHKHPRQSEVVETIFSSGFRTIVTKDHSFFTFDSSSRLVPCFPRENQFAKICLTAPNIEEPKTLDLVKEFYEKLPPEYRARVYCTILGLNQPQMRMLSSNRKLLNAIVQKPTSILKIAKEAALDAGTVGDVSQRLTSQGYAISEKKGKHRVLTVTAEGKKYQRFLEWLFFNCKYYKRKYRVPLARVAESPLKVEKFCKIMIEANYGKIKLPRFLEVNKPLAELLGLYVAEGDARSTSFTAGIHLAAQKKEMQRRMADCVKEGLGIKPSITSRGVDINSKLAYYLIKYVFRAGIGSYNKEVPSIIFTLPTAHKWRFLEGYARGDGHITDKRIVLTTVSKKLVTGLIFLLRQLGIKKMTLQKNPKRTTFDLQLMESVPFQEINVHGKKCYYDLIPVGQKNQKTFALMQNLFLSQNKGLKTREIGIVTEQNCFDYIKKIVPLKNQPPFVYDISVDKTQLFIGGQGLICLHNSVAEEGLDIPSVDLVIFYEPVPSEIRTIQRRGRTGRWHEGRCIVLMARHTRDEAFYYSSKAKEKNMHKILVEMQKKPENTLPNREKQTTLGKFSSEKNDKVEIFVDTREQASSVVRELTELGAVIHVKQLETGDYIVGPEAAVERKTAEDFLNSMIDGRLFNQLKNMSDGYQTPVIILEGNPSDLFTMRNIHKNAIIGALSSISIDYRIPILFSQDAKETAEFLYIMARREQLYKEKDLRLRTGRKGLTLPESQQFVIESLPMVGPTMAKSLLEHFKSVRGIMNANEKELQEVSNMGEKKAKKITRLLNARYKEKENPASNDSDVEGNRD